MSPGSRLNSSSYSLKALTESCEPQNQHRDQDRAVLKMGCFPLLNILPNVHSPAALRTAWLLSLQAPFHPLAEKSSSTALVVGASHHLWLAAGGGRMAANVTPALGWLGLRHWPPAKEP